MNTYDKIELPSSDEAAAHMLPSDLKKFESGEHVAEAFSIAVGNPDETSQPLFTLDQVRAAIEADRKQRAAFAHFEADHKWLEAAARTVAELAAIIPVSDIPAATATCQDMIDYFKRLIADRKRRGEPVAWHSKLYGTVWMAIKPGSLVPGTQWFIDGRTDPVAEVISPVSLVWRIPTGDLPHGTVFYSAPQPAEPVAFRVMRKTHDGKWVTDGRGWCDGAPSADLLADIAKRSDGWRIEHAYGAPQPAEPVKGSVDIDDVIAESIARGEMTKEGFLEARQWVRDTYYKPAEPVKGQTGKTVLQSNQSLNEAVKVPSNNDILGLASKYNLEHPIRVLLFARDLLARYRNSDIGQSAEQPDYTSAAKACRSVGANSFAECFERAAQHKAAKCDGDHGGPRCADPECWNDSSD